MHGYKSTGQDRGRALTSVVWYGFCSHQVGVKTSIAGALLALSTFSCGSEGTDSTSDGDVGTGAAPGVGGTVTSTGGMEGSSGGTAGNSGGTTGDSGGSAGNAGGAAGNSGGAAGNSGGTDGAGGATVGAGGETAGAGGSIPIDQPDLVTSGVGAYFQEGALTEVTSTANVTVDTGTRHQTWHGFGGTFNEAGWDALMTLDPNERTRALQLLFDISTGAGFDWGRIPIGSSDYALSRYSLAETPDDLTMSNFSIARDHEALIPYIQAALGARSDIRFWASPWSPPAWMKDSGQIDGTDEYDGRAATFESSMLSDPAILTAYALYFKRFVEEYATEGILIDHVQPQNEPGYITRYPSCRWAPGLLGTFVADYLGPALEPLGTDIWFGTLSNADTYSGHIGGLTGAAANYTTGVGLQWNTIGNIGALSNDGYLVMQTEHKCGNYPWNPAGFPAFNPNQPPNDHAYGVESWGLIKEWIEAGAHIYSAWNMVLDTQGHNLDTDRPWPQNALLVVDRGAQTLTETAAYYVFRHLSQFVDVGATRVGVSGGDALAFENPDGSLVAVLHNSGGSVADTTVAIGGTTVQISVPAQGWATVNIQ